MESEALSIPMRLLEVARAHATRPAVSYPRVISYGELVEQAQRCALFMREQGVVKGRHVVLWLACPADSVRMSLATLYAGAAFVPVEERTPLPRVEQIIEHCDASLIVVDAHRVAQLPRRLRDRTVLVEALNAAGNEPGLLDTLPPVGGDDPAYVIFTSGSTGEPKGVVISHANLVHLVRARVQLYGSAPHLLPSHPCSFDPFQGAVWWALAEGGSLVLLRTPELADLELMASLIGTHQLAFLSVVPSLYEALLKHSARSDLNSLKTVIVGGEALSNVLADLHHARARDCALFNEYGPTEATVVSTAYLVPPRPPSPIPIGTPLLNVTCYVVSEAGVLCAPGEVGELYIGGGGVALGYLNRPDLSAAKFVEAPFANQARVYRTGDRARWNDRSELEFLGRLDGQLKLRGNRIEPEEIELALLTLPGITQAGVVARVLHGRDPVLVAFYATSGPVAVDAVERELRKRLPPYMVPAAYFEMETLPRTPTGKLDRALLAGMPVAESHVELDVVPLTTPAELDLARVWSQVLAVPIERIGKTSEFFSLGGHSLLFARVERVARSDFDWTAPLSAFWSHTTLSGLAAELTPASELPGRESMRPIDRFRLAPVQETFYYLAELQRNSSAYTVGATVRILGSVDAARLRRAALSVYASNDVLRARLVRRPIVSELAVQPMARREEWFSWSVETATDAKAAETLAQAFTTQLIPIDAVALVRFQWLSVSETEHLISLAAHHLVVDGTSVHLLFSELWKYYKDPDAAPPQSRSYGAFALMTRKNLTEETRTRLKDTRKRQLDNLGSPSQVPYARNLAAVPAGARSQLIVPVAPELTRRVRAFARSRQATPFMVTLAATGVVLARYHGEPEAVVGTPISLRGLGDFADTVGCMVNSAVLRLVLDSWDGTFDDWVQATRRAVTEAALSAELPIAAVYEALGRSASEAPLFRFFFNYLDRTSECTELQGARLVPVLEGAATPKFDITLYVHDWGTHWDLEFGFAPQFYDEITIHAFASQILHVLRHVTDHAAESSAWQLLHIPLHAPVAAQEVSAHGAAGHGAAAHDAAGRDAAVPTATIHARFAALAVSAGERVAVDDGVRVWSYHELARRARSVADAIRAAQSSGLPRVAILATRTARFVAAVIACLESGAPYTLVDAAQPPSLQRALLEAFGATLILDLDDAFSGDLSITVVRAATFLEAPSEANLCRLTASPEQAVYTLFTSGTTGQAKGVVGGHLPVVHFLEWQSLTYEFSASDRFALLSGLAHDPIFRDLFAPLSQGACLFIPSTETRGEPDKLAAWISDRAISVVHVTPPLVELLANTSQTFPSLRVVFSGGDRLRPHQAQALFRVAPNAQIVNCYGLTETPQVIARAELSRDEAFASVPLGAAVPGFDLRLLNGADMPCATHELGEIVVHSEYLAQGFWVNGSLARLDLGQGAPLLRTRDLARRDAQGRLHFVRRADREAKLRAFRISLEEVESLLMSAPHVASARVLVHSKQGEPVLWAFVTGAGERPRESVLRAHVAARAVAAAVPQRIYVVERFPLTRNGKLDERGLLALAESYDEATPPSSVRLAVNATPQTQTEELVQRHWSQCLSRSFVGMDQTFFDLGGNSILAVQLLSRLGNELGIAISVETLMQHPTPRLLAAALLRENRELEESLVVSINATGTLPLVWMFHPVGGHVTFARRFAKLVGEDQPICAIQARGLDGIQAPIESMAEMIALYSSLVRQHQPVGPYYLAGPSLGGRLALEVARFLASQGEQVAMVALFDSYGPGFPGPAPVLQRLWGSIRGAFQRLFGGAPAQDYQPHDYQPLLAPGHPTGALVRAVTRVNKVNRQLSRAFKHPFYDGPVWLFRARQLPTDRFGADFSDPTNGWGKATRQVTVREVNCTHQTIMDHPGVDELVRHFQRALDECRSQVGHFNEHDPHGAL